MREKEVYAIKHPSLCMLPMQPLIQMEWWSCLATQALQEKQWFALIGFLICKNKGFKIYRKPWRTLTTYVPVSTTVKPCRFPNRGLAFSTHAWTHSVIMLWEGNRSEFILHHFPIQFSVHHLPFLSHHWKEITYHTWRTKYPGIQTACLCQNQNVLQRDRWTC